MHLADNPSNQSLKEASRLLDIPEIHAEEKH